MKTTAITYALILLLTTSIILAGFVAAGKGIEVIKNKIHCVETALGER